MDASVYKTIRTNGALPDPTTIEVNMVVEDLWDAYVDSSMSLLHDMEAAAMKLEAGQDVEENAAMIRRLLHSIKGEAGMTGMMDIHYLAHEAETAFDELFKKGNAADMVLKVKDWMVDVVNYVSTLDLSQIVRQNSFEKEDKRKVKALCVDDDPLCAKRLNMLLSDFCDCDFAENGLKAVELYKWSLENCDPYKLVTLDIQMPEMDGHETLQAIRQLEEQKGIFGLDGVKIIMLTSQATSDHIFGSFREGCEAYVIKSYMGEKLLEEMTKLNLLKARTLYSIK